MRPSVPQDDVYLGGVSVLVVDDNKPVRAAVAAMLNTSAPASAARPCEVPRAPGLALLPTEGS